MSFSRLKRARRKQSTAKLLTLRLCDFTVHLQTQSNTKYRSSDFGIGIGTPVIAGGISGSATGPDDRGRLLDAQEEREVPQGNSTSEEKEGA